MIPQLIAIARQYRSYVEGRITNLKRHLDEEPFCYRSENSGRKDFENQISYWEATLEMIDKALKVPAALEDDMRLVAATFLIALDKETNPEPMAELGDILSELVQIDVDVESTGRGCQAAEIRDACDVTELVVRDFTVDVGVNM